MIFYEKLENSKKMFFKCQSLLDLSSRRLPYIGSFIQAFPISYPMQRFFRNINLLIFLSQTVRRNENEDNPWSSIKSLLFYLSPSNDCSFTSIRLEVNWVPSRFMAHDSCDMIDIIEYNCSEVRKKIFLKAFLCLKWIISWLNESF